MKFSLTTHTGLVFHVSCLWGRVLYRLLYHGNLKLLASVVQTIILNEKIFIDIYNFINIKYKNVFMFYKLKKYLSM